MTVTTKRSLIALLLSLVLVVSLFTVSISATDKGSEAGTEVSATEAVSSAEEESAKETNAATDKETTEKDEAVTESDAEKAEREEREETTTSLIINGAIIAAIIVIIVLVAVKFRTKLFAFLRSVKSEFKKVVWSSKENTRKSFLVVVVVAVAVAALIFVIDFAFNQGITMLGDLFKK